MLMQIGISTLAYAVQLAVVRYVPGRRRRMVWTGLRLVAALSLAMLWMLGTYVMRAPASLATKVAGIAPVLAFSPAMLVSAPLAALVRGQPAHAVARDRRSGRRRRRGDAADRRDRPPGGHGRLGGGRRRLGRGDARAGADARVFRRPRPRTFG